MAIAVPKMTISPKRSPILEAAEGTNGCAAFRPAVGALLLVGVAAFRVRFGFQGRLPDVSAVDARLDGDLLNGLLKRQSSRIAGVAIRARRFWGRRHRT